MPGDSRTATVDPVIRQESIDRRGFHAAAIRAIEQIKNDREFSRKILDKYVHSDDPQFINLALDHRLRTLPDVPYPSVRP
jgi:hypothetical protein